MPLGFTYVWPLPDLSRFNDPNLALPSDMQWLRDNPEAVARVRTWDDPDTSGGRTILLAFRVREADSLDGWHLAHHKTRPFWSDSAEFRTWQATPDFRTGNDLAMFVLQCDSLMDRKPSPRSKKLFAPVETLDHLGPQWRGKFAPAGEVAHG